VRKGTQPHRERAISALFASQKTLATVGQLADLGLTPRAIQSRAQVGRLHRVHSGVYSTTPPALLPVRACWLAAVLACGPGAVLSHRSAAALWGIHASSRAATDVTTLTGRGRKVDGVEAHRAATLTPADITTVDGIPVTSIARTILDLASVVLRRRVERAIDQAEELGWFDLQALDDVLHRNPTLRGTPIVLAVLDEYQRAEPHLSTLTESPLEDGFLALCDAAGFPRPEVQQYLTLPGGDVIRADFLWRAQRIVVETDGRKGHTTSWSREQNARRDLLLTQAHWRPVRLTWRMVFKTPAETTRTFGSLLAATTMASP
jgi:hypothetical protein